MANQRLIEELKNLRAEVVRRMESKSPLYSKEPGQPERDVTDEQRAADRKIVADLDHIIESASRD